MSKILIVCGGTLADAFLEAEYRRFSPDVCIAVDGALEHFARTGLRVTHMVGDFDTVRPELLEQFSDGSRYIERHCPQKNETDTELAVMLALELAPEEIEILGATGNRMDHTLANLDMLYEPYCAGVPCRIVDACNEITLIGSRVFLKPDPRYKYVSFFPFTDHITNLCLRGFAYPIEGYEIRRGKKSGRCISNEITAETAEVSIGKGLLFCIRSRDPKAERSDQKEECVCAEPGHFD